MKHKTKKALSWLLSLALVLGLMPGMSMTAWAASQTWTSGDCTVTYDPDTKTMTVTGNGGTNSYN